MRVVELGQLLPVREAHRLAEVHHQVAGDVGLGLELLDVVLVGLGEDQPVDVLGVVAVRVAAVLAELDREAVKRAGVQPLQKPFTTNWARRSSRLIWLMTSGLRYFSTEPWKQSVVRHCRARVLEVRMAIESPCHTARTCLPGARLAFDIRAFGVANFDISAPGFPSAAADDVFGGHAFGLGLEVGAEAVAEDGDGDFLDVVDGDAEAAVHRGQGLAAVDEELAGAGPAPQSTRSLTNCGAVSSLGRVARTSRATYLTMYSLTATECTSFCRLTIARDERILRTSTFSVRVVCVEDPFFLVGDGIADLDVEHEAVELGFGQRIGPFLLDRVLRGDDEERIGQVVGLPADGDLALLHRLQQGGLRLGRRAVDFVGQQDVREDRPFDEAEVALARLRLPPARWCR